MEVHMVCPTKLQSTKVQKSEKVQKYKTEKYKNTKTHKMKICKYAKNVYTIVHSMNGEKAEFQGTRLNQQSWIFRFSHAIYFANLQRHGHALKLQ